MAVGRPDGGAHPSQRHGHPLHRACGERLVAYESNGGCSGRRGCREHPHQRAFRVPALDRLGGDVEPGEAPAAHTERIDVVVENLDADCARIARIVDSVSD